MELHDRRDQKDDGPSADERGLQGYLLTKIAKSDQDTNGEGHPTEGGAEQ